MTQQTTPPANATPIGMIRLNGTSYQVFKLETSEAAKASGIVGHYAAEGPKGARFLITDFGPKFNLTSVSMGTADSKRLIAFRPLRGLTRSIMAPFGVEV